MQVWASVYSSHISLRHELTSLTCVTLSLTLFSCSLPHLSIMQNPLDHLLRNSGEPCCCLAHHRMVFEGAAYQLQPRYIPPQQLGERDLELAMSPGNVHFQKA